MERIDLFVEHTLFILGIDRFHVFGSRSVCSFRFTSQIDSRGVIQLILQYLQENNLTESYNTLAKETRSGLRVLCDR